MTATIQGPADIFICVCFSFEILLKSTCSLPAHYLALKAGFVAWLVTSTPTATGQAANVGNLHVHALVCVHMCPCVRATVYVCKRVCAYVCSCECLCVCVCVHVCIYVCARECGNTTQAQLI